MSNPEKIDLTSSEDVICISDDENQTQNHLSIDKIGKQRSSVDDICSRNENKTRSESSKFFGKLNPEFEKNLKLALKENIEKRKNMGCVRTPPNKSLKLKTWSRKKTEMQKEKEKNQQYPSKEPSFTYISSDSENEQEDAFELPDLDEVIAISDDEGSSQKATVVAPVVDLSTDESGDEGSGKSCRSLSGSSSDDNVTVIQVQIIESGEENDDDDDEDDDDHDEKDDISGDNENVNNVYEDISPATSPLPKRRKLSDSPLSDSPLKTDNLTSIEDKCSDGPDKDVKRDTIDKLIKNQDKITTFLNKIKTVNFGKVAKELVKQDSREESVSETESLDEPLNSPSGSGRHFLDRIHKFNSDNDDSEPEQIELKKKVRKTKKIRTVVRKNDYEDRKITSYYNVKKDLHKKCFWQRSKVKTCPSDQDIETTLVGAFVDFHINTVEGCWEDEMNHGFMRHGVQFLRNFSLTCMPPPELVQSVIEKGMISSKSEQLIKDSFDCLLFIHEKYPGLVQVDYKHLQDSLEQLNFGKRFDEQCRVLVTKAKFVLRLVILCYEHELSSKDISDPKKMRQTASYKALSYECHCGFQNVKELIAHYIHPLIHHEQTFQQEVPEILPLLQKLLYISIEVSSNCNAAAKSIAAELSKHYGYLPSMDLKKMYIRTIESNVLRFYLVMNVLERQCENTNPCYDFPVKLKELFQCFFKAFPPSNISTPPTTPQSDDESMDNAVNVLTGYSPANVEELLMLLFEVLQCYLQCNQDKSHTTLRRRAYMRKEDFNFSLSEEEKDLIFRNTEELREHVLMLSPDLTTICEQYLNLILCTVDWQKA